MIYFLLFLLELVVLFLLSKKLVNSLAKTFYKFRFSHKTVVRILAVLFLPGTILHELSHLLVAGVLLIPVGELSVLPEVEGASVKLGSVQIGRADPIRMTLVGIAPVLFGLGAILFILTFFNFRIWWQAVPGLYLIFEIGNSMFSSKRDLEGVIGFLVAILIVALLIFGGLYFLNKPISEKLIIFLGSLDYSGIINLLKKGCMYLTIPIAIDLAIILFTRPLYNRNR